MYEMTISHANKSILILTLDTVLHVMIHVQCICACIEETITLPHEHWVPECAHMSINIWQKIYWQMLLKQLTIQMSIAHALAS